MINKFFDFVDQRGLVRRVVLAVAIWQTWTVTVWAMHFAEHSSRTGLDFAALIGAVTAPVTAFGGFVFKSYIESRGSA